MSVCLLLSLTGCFEKSQNETDQKTVGHIGLEPLPVMDVKFYSESLQRDMHINVVLLRGYEDSGISYPTLYLCHGFTSNYHEFTNVGVPEYLNRFDMIVVMVDVGNSLYVNWAKSDDGRPYKFADHVCKDVINYVDQNYRTIAERKGRAINGISMGGFGALSLGLTHPDLFCSIASHSGGLRAALDASETLKQGENTRDLKIPFFMNDTTRYLNIDVEDFSTFKERTPLGKPFVTPEDADKVDPFKLVLQIPKDKLPHIYLDCGDKDFLIEASQDFMKLLLENNIPFQYGQSDGVHEENYWGREVSVSMAVQYAVMLRNIWGREFEVYNPYKKLED
jgi:S-formylglutathione hydrolase FrmB